MKETVVLVSDLATELGMDKSNLRRYIIDHGIGMAKVRTQNSRGQLTLALSIEGAEAVRAFRQTDGYASQVIVSDGPGYFYIVQVIPELLPTRVKLGYATSPETRLKAHQTSAPTASLLKVWPCKRVWEQTVIDSITRVDCTLVANEVFDCGKLDSLIQRGNVLFSLMPDLD